jgi:hypothetical protein
LKFSGVDRSIERRKETPENPFNASDTIAVVLTRPPAGRNDDDPLLIHLELITDI